MTIFGFTKIKLVPVTIKLWGMLGQNNDNTVMMGGYATTFDTTNTDNINKGIVEYTPFNTATAWFEIHTNGKKIQGGLFAGYSTNLGADKEIVAGSQVGRWMDIESMMRVSPRLFFFSGKTKIGAEIEYSYANYAKQKVDSSGIPIGDTGGIDKFGKVTNFEKADNIRFLLSFNYSF